MKLRDPMFFGRNYLKTLPGLSVTAVLLGAPTVSNLALANGGGYGSNLNRAGNTIDVQTFYASSPQGIRPAYDITAHTLSTTETLDTGVPLRKFVEPLGGAVNYNGLDGTGIPVAITEKWLNPITGQQTADDYYEIAVVEYTQKMHPDLPKGSTLRGYVQIETPAIAAGLKDITGLIVSEHIAAYYPDGTTPIKDSADNQVYFVHAPHYLGPVIVASKGTPVRMKYTNYLPYTDKNGVKVGSPSGGEMPIPVDESIAGGGPILDKNGNETARKFSQNRVSIHWHGGDTPWVSDGTPHQWIAPAGDISWEPGVDGSHLGHGVSFQNVPDMPDPGHGSGTLYFPNNLSGRLMFYHDHTSGLTRLNVYMGEAAGYVVVDPDELGLAASAIGTTLGTTTVPTTGPFAGATVPTGLLDSVGIPLVIQDKTFVPKNIGPIGGNVTVNGQTSTVTQSQDAKWDLNHWGQPGDLWYPHVYETNQDPNSWDGTNPTGRWDWGPWFWPVFPSQFSLPSGNYRDPTNQHSEVTVTPEAFMDTPIVNGQAYPTLTVEPKTYRFRILNAANDRTQNLSLFQAVDANGQVCDATNLAPARAATLAGGVPPETCTEIRMVPAVPTPGFPAKWPTDARVGGVPDPATAGPDMVQIGSEGGLLPAPVIHKPQPITFDLDKRSITILNVLDHGVLLGGAERADVLVDFSKYAGKTLILYNDAPTPMPAVDPRTDYFTGMAGMTGVGGAYDVLPGYGPNTRTIMQIKVANNTPSAPLNVAKLAQDLPVAYAKTQPAPLIPQAAYNAPFGTNNADNFAQIYTGGLTQPYLQLKGTTFGITGVDLVSGGSGYSAANPPKVTITAPPTGGRQATATAHVNAAGVVDQIIMGDLGAGYTNTVPLTATIDAPTARGASRALAKVNVNAFKIINKAIQELFDPVFGRMNATLAVELPFTSQANATTIPLAYIDTPVESLDAIKDGETQIWKITHNGVDSHPVHFHLMNVQLINRVDWAGVIKPPKPMELGWKETITMNPLEDVYVAARAVRPVVPFGLPTSNRLLDPSQAVGSTIAFTNIDPTTGQLPTSQRQLVNGVPTDVPTSAYSNQLTEFDNEYVWHCHILGHEENDFMRPMIFHPTVLRPDAPTNVAVTGNTVSWVDPTPVAYELDVNTGKLQAVGVDAAGVPTAGIRAGLPGAQYTVEPTNNAKNEIGFLITRTQTATVTTSTPPTAPGGAPTVTSSATQSTTVVPVPANATNWVDPVGVPLTTQLPDPASKPDPATTVISTTTYTVKYDVVAYNAAGESLAGQSVVQSAPLAAPAVPVGTGVTSTAPPAPSGVTLSPSGLTWNAVPGATGYWVTVGAGTPVMVNTNSIALTAADLGKTVTVAALMSGVTGDAASVLNGAALPPVALTNSNGRTGSIQPGSITLTWANNPLNVNNVTGLTLTWGRRGSNVMASKTFPVTSTGVTLVGLAADVDYNISLIANGVLGNSAPLNRMVLSAP